MGTNEVAPPGAAGSINASAVAVGMEGVSLIYDEIRDAIDSGSRGRIARALPRAEALRSDAERLSAALASIGRQASHNEIVAHLAKLLGAMPNLAKIDETVFTGQLIEDVGDDMPTIGALVMGCRKVRHTCKYLPSISEVLAAIREMESQLRSATTRSQQLSERISEARTILGLPAEI